MIELINSPGFWLAVMQIIAIDILLGGDNAVVIALACRKLPEAQRNRAIIGGALGAILLRIAMIFFALQLLELPYLKLIGAVLLLWIGIKLIVPEGEDAHDNLAAREVFLHEDPENLQLVGLALRGPKKSVDKAIKGLSLHP